MRLIDADELKEQFAWSEVCRLSITEINQIINDAPTVSNINVAINIIKDVCNHNNMCIHCPMNHNCNEHPQRWEVITGIDPNSNS